MKIAKQKFRIGELAKRLDVEKFVIRFWEKEFGLKGHRSHGGQRFYDDKDLQKFSLIKDLLYVKGFTIAGAKNHLKSARIVAPKAVKKQEILASTTTTFENKYPQNTTDASAKKQIPAQLLELQKKLIKLRELL